MPELVVVRHGKSDWSVPVGDRHRPLAGRGRRQAPATGRWIAEHVGSIDVAVVSPATRAQQTWELVSAELRTAPRVEVSEAAYTFAGRDLLGIVRTLPDSATTVALVGHNPAAEELVETLAGQWVRLPTSALAVLALPSWPAAAGTAKIRYAGRPADD